MFMKTLRKISSLQLVIIFTLCMCYWIALRIFSISSFDTEDDLIISLAKSKLKSRLHPEPTPRSTYATVKRGGDVRRGDAGKPSTHEFVEYKAKGLVTLHNLCIENEPNGTTIDVDTNQTVIQKMLVVYQAERDETRKVRVAHNENRPEAGTYDIHFYKRKRPEGFRFIEDYPAYFTVPSCTANLHHFWADSTEGLYKTLKYTNRLGSRIPNQVY